MNIPKWPYRIWAEKTESVLRTSANDGRNLQTLIAAYGEATAILAWTLYVRHDPPTYNLEPLKRRTRRWGKYGEFFTEEDDDSTVTKYPLTSFLSPKVLPGYVIAAQEQRETLKTLYTVGLAMGPCGTKAIVALEEIGFFAA